MRQLGNQLARRQGYALDVGCRTWQPSVGNRCSGGASAGLYDTCPCIPLFGRYTIRDLAFGWSLRVMHVQAAG